MLAKFALFRVLKTLLESTEEMSLRETARKSNTGVSAVKYSLDFLKSKGMVSYKTAGRTHLYTLKNHHILVKHIKIISTLNELTDAGLIEEILKDNMGVISIILYGSSARGENTPKSDIDLLLITNKAVKIKHPKSEIKITREVSYITYTPHQWRIKTRENKPFYDRLITEGIILHGERPIVT